MVASAEKKAKDASSAVARSNAELKKAQAGILPKNLGNFIQHSIL